MSGFRPGVDNNSGTVEYELAVETSYPTTSSHIWVGLHGLRNRSSPLKSYQAHAIFPEKERRSPSSPSNVWAPGQAIQGPCVEIGLHTLFGAL